MHFSNLDFISCHGICRLLKNHHTLFPSDKGHKSKRFAERRPSTPGQGWQSWGPERSGRRAVGPHPTSDRGVTAQL